MRFFSTLIASTLGVLLAFGILLLFLFIFILSITLTMDTAPEVRRGSVLHVRVSGDYPDLAADDPLLRLTTGRTPQDLSRFRSNLRKAAADSRIRGLWLEFGGVSASWATMQEMREVLLRFKESGKPVYATSADYFMGEADYFLASVADSIFLPPQGLFEFNGFYVTAEFYASMLDKLDIEAQIVRAGEFKSAVEPFTRTDLSPENREQLTAILEDWNQVFVDAVASSREMASDHVQVLLESADVFTAAEAYAAGLVDGLLYDHEISESFKRRLGVDPEDDLETVDGRAYSFVSASDAGIKTGNEGEIAIVHATGAMVPGSSGVDPNPLFGGVVVGSRSFRDAMEEARDSDRVRAIVVRIDSPGGFTPAADEMWSAVRLAAAEKPVIVSMGGYAASGGYWLATAAETIVADPLTLTGSIGVFSMFFDVGNLLEDRIGITFDEVATTAHADMFSGLRPLTPAERAILERSTEETYLNFLTLVSESRNMTTDEVEAVAQGRVWTGLRAREIGLVDSLGSLSTAVALAAERAGLEPDTYRVRMLPRPPGLMDMLSNRFGSSISAAWGQLFSTPLERAARQRLSLLSEAATWQGKVMARMPIDVRIR